MEKEYMIPNPEKEMSVNEYELYNSGMSIRDISKISGKPIATLWGMFKKAGITRGHAEAIQLAASQGKIGSGWRGKKMPPRSEEHQKKISMANMGKTHSDEAKKKISMALLRNGELYAKGTSKKNDGYVKYTRGDNMGRNEHTVLMEKYIGRRITQEEVVHHINGVRDDNRIENLQLMTRGDHASLHNSLRGGVTN